MLPNRRQHGEEIEVIIDTAAAPQLGAVVNDAADLRADQGPAADRVGAHELAGCLRADGTSACSDRFTYVGASKADVGSTPEMASAP
jgi:hypothetical protein